MTDHRLSNRESTWHDEFIPAMQGEFTAPDAAMHSVRHLVHTSEVNCTSILVAVKERWNTVHTSASLRLTGCSRWPKLD